MRANRNRKPPDHYGTLRNYVHKLAKSKHMRRVHFAVYAAYYALVSIEDHGVKLIAVMLLVGVLTLHEIDEEL